jgi:aryl-alcohol dehydrogenase-like predicted oxidoreductase
LTGQFKKPEDLPADDRRRAFPRFQGENFHKNLDLVEKVAALAKQKGCTPGQLALAWVMAQGDDVIPIPGTKRMKYLEENVAALNVKLSADELAALDAILPPGVASGMRYPEHGMAALNR